MRVPRTHPPFVDEEQGGDSPPAPGHTGPWTPTLVRALLQTPPHSAGKFSLQGAAFLASPTHPCQQAEGQQPKDTTKMESTTLEISNPGGRREAVACLPEASACSSRAMLPMPAT